MRIGKKLSILIKKKIVEAFSSWFKGSVYLSYSKLVCLLTGNITQLAGLLTIFGEVIPVLDVVAISKRSVLHTVNRVILVFAYCYFCWKEVFKHHFHSKITKRNSCQNQSCVHFVMRYMCRHRSCAIDSLVLPMDLSSVIIMSK